MGELTKNLGELTKIFGWVDWSTWVSWSQLGWVGHNLGELVFGWVGFWVSCPTSHLLDSSSVIAARNVLKEDIMCSCIEWRGKLIEQHWHDKMKYNDTFNFFLKIYFVVQKHAILLISDCFSLVRTCLNFGKIKNGYYYMKLEKPVAK